jgi:propionyl-CoA carboxylase alpha chain
VNYQSAGTVEFVVGKDQSFYFLEMNTRLQVEHPVTECITGLDLVEQMIRIAAGEPLAFAQADIARRGWAMECRINAEDPLRGFLPSTGRLVKYQPPAQTMHAAQAMPADGGVRVDTGFAEGGEIPIHYDSMIAKLIVHGHDRADAMRRMREALNAFVIRGVASNIGFQSALLAHPKFISGDFNTGFIAEQYPGGFCVAEGAPDERRFLLALAAAAHRRGRERAARISGQLPGHELQLGQDFVVVHAGSDGRRQQTPVKVSNGGDGYRVSIGDATSHLRFRGPLRDLAVHGESDGLPFCAQIERIGLDLRITHNGMQVQARVLTARAAELLALMPVKAAPDLSRFLLSPMPGLLVDVAVTTGQAVRTGERLAVIEAMKMENVLIAQQDAVIAKIVATKGETLAVDQVIMEFE